MAQVRSEFLDSLTHLFVYCHIVYGRKPGVIGGGDDGEEEMEI